MNRFLKIAECDGGIEIVEKKDFDRIFEEVAEVLASEGPASVLALKEQARKTTPSGVRTAILLTIIEEFPSGAVRLRPADEVDYYRLRAE